MWNVQYNRLHIAVRGPCMTYGALYWNVFEGAVQADLARSYGVSEATISRLAAASPFEHGAVGL